MIKYKYLYAWDTMMHSAQYWKDMKQREAKEDNAPEDVIYKDTNGKWRRFGEIQSEETKIRIQKMVDEMNEREILYMKGD